MKDNGTLLKQGLLPVIITILLTVLFVLLESGFFIFVSFIVLIGMFYVFKNPDIEINRDDKAVLAPVDGTITAIDTIEDEKLIFCKVSLADTHVVRSPISSSMKIIGHRYGLNLNPNSYKGYLLNEFVEFEFDYIKLKLLSGVCNVSIDYSENPQVTQGERVSVFIDGIAVIRIKNDVELNINIGDKILAGQTKIAVLNQG